MDSAQKRGELIALLESALTLAEEINDGTTGYLIERAFDEARGTAIQAGAPSLSVRKITINDEAAN
jgi:hypothetical protein